MLSSSAWANIAQEITCTMLIHSPQTTLHKKIIYNFVWIYLGQHCTRKLLVQCWPTWLTDNVYAENNLCNAVLTILGQHCIIILSSQCCPNTSEPTLHKKANCTVLAQSTQTCFHRKAGCSFKCLVACSLTRYNIIKQSWLFLFNVSSGVHLWLAGQ